jgi:hypothetical protein
MAPKKQPIIITALTSSSSEAVRLRLDPDEAVIPNYPGRVAYGKSRAERVWIGRKAVVVEVVSEIEHKLDGEAVGLYYKLVTDLQEILQLCEAIGVEPPESSYIFVADFQNEY